VRLLYVLGFAGVGIPTNKLSSMFEAFSQVQTGQVTGTGLGLFGVRTRAEGLQGTCGARHNTESSTGTGTVLWFAIPYTPNYDLLNEFAHVRVPSPLLLSPDITRNNSDNTSSNAKRSAADSPVPSPTLRASPVPTSHIYRTATVNFSAREGQPITHTASTEFGLATDEVIRRLHLSAMVVEDTASVRKLMERLLLKMGFESVVCYENGSKGLEAMMAAPVDIVFSDVQMPIMTGPEVILLCIRFTKT